MAKRPSGFYSEIEAGSNNKLPRNSGEDFVGSDKVLMQDQAPQQSTSKTYNFKELPKPMRVVLDEKITVSTGYFNSRFVVRISGRNEVECMNNDPEVPQSRDGQKSPSTLQATSLAEEGESPDMFSEPPPRFIPQPKPKCQAPLVFLTPEEFMALEQQYEEIVESTRSPGLLPGGFPKPVIFLVKPGDLDNMSMHQRERLSYVRVSDRIEIFSKHLEVLPSSTQTHSLMHGRVEISFRSFLKLARELKPLIENVKAFPFYSLRDTVAEIIVDEMGMAILNEMKKINTGVKITKESLTQLPPMVRGVFFKAYGNFHNFGFMTNVMRQVRLRMKTNGVKCDIDLWAYARQLVEQIETILGAMALIV